MAQFATSVQVLCALVLLLGAGFVPDPAAAISRGAVVSFAIRAWCIPRMESLLTEHEGRHECVYKLHNGDKAVGVGYNLDREVDTRRSELATVLADYDKVYSGESCLNAFQISALLTFDARRALDRAAERVKSLDDQCCSVMAVFGDIQHSGGQEAFEGNGFEDFIEAVGARNWHKAGDKLEETPWCKEHKERCRGNKAIIYEGCGDDSFGDIAQVTSLTG